MKKALTSISLLMVAIMLFAITATAFSSNVLDNPNFTYENGFKYVEKTTTESGKTQKIFYGEYNPTVEGAEYELNEAQQAAVRGSYSASQASLEKLFTPEAGTMN